MPRKYYALFTCDNWKSYASMRFCGIFTRGNLLSLLRKKVKARDMEIDKETLKCLDTMTVQEINNVLMYGFIQECAVNEVA